jgi:hypothetical protein
MVVSVASGCLILQQAGEIHVDCVFSTVPSPLTIDATKLDRMFLARAIPFDVAISNRIEVDQATDVESVCMLSPDSRLEMNAEYMGITGTAATMLYIIKPVWPSGLRR